MSNPFLDRGCDIPLSWMIGVQVSYENQHVDVFVWARTPDESYPPFTVRIESFPRDKAGEASKLGQELSEFLVAYQALTGRAT